MTDYKVGFGSKSVTDQMKKIINEAVRAELVLFDRAARIRSDLKRREQNLKARIEAEQAELERQLEEVIYSKAGSLRKLINTYCLALNAFDGLENQPSDVYRLLHKMSRDVYEVGRVDEEEIRLDEDEEGARIGLPPCPQHTTIDAPDDDSVVNELNTCRVTLRDYLGRVVRGWWDYSVVVAMYDTELKPVYVTVRNRKDGIVEVNYFPTMAGTYTLFVGLNGVNVANSPRCLHIGGYADAAPPVPVVVFGEEGQGDSQFCRPWGICCDRRGRILVADRCNNRVQIFNEHGHFVWKFGRKGSSPGEFLKPAGLTVDKFDRIIVADKDNHRVQIFDRRGYYISHFGKFDEFGEDGFMYPWDVAVTSECHIAVTETNRRRVRLFTDSGVPFANCSFEGFSPRGIEIAQDGSFLVTDFNSHELIWMDASLRVVRRLGSRGTGAGEFLRPQSVAVRSGTMFAVSDCKNHRIQVFEDDLLMKIIGRQGSEPGEVDAPQGIAFHPNGCLVVVDYGNNRIQMFDVS